VNKKDEALNKCLRVLNPIANEKVYESQWVDSAIHACHEALEKKEEPQYLYAFLLEVGTEEGQIVFGLDDSHIDGFKYLGKIKLKVEDDLEL
jgi:hypothetical protein